MSADFTEGAFLSMIAGIRKQKGVLAVRAANQNIQSGGKKGLVDWNSLPGKS